MNPTPETFPQQILIVGPSWVGDMVMAQTLFKLLKSERPDCAIDVLAPAWSRPLLERMPEVRAAVDMPLGHGKLGLGERRRLGRALGGRGYQQAILLPNSLKSALVPWFAGIPRRTGWRGEMRYGLLNDLRVLDKDRYPLMIQRFAALGLEKGAALPQQLPYPKLEVGTDAAELRGRLSLDAQRPVLALCPGAEFGPSKRWPEQHYAAVAEERVGRGWQVWLMGSANDRAVCEQIVERLSDKARQWAFNLAGETSLGQAIDLLAEAGGVVSNDSGLMHVAAALGRPLVAVYGSTSPGFTPPLGERVRVVSIEVECGPCFQRECPLGHHKCMAQLMPDRVVSALDQLTT
ncbi:lipopolysaccharide heptosyltransferase II [Microbulbifer sp.]|uniref:lipopolysaccharide heptosyltransferase II n=1 Tax=Microbulbifer sp. TaxID=1908541 RepID=UPI003F38E1AC